MRITKEEAAKTLLGMDNILILAHENPDGDAVGSATALCKALRLAGKKAFVNIEEPAKIDAYLLEGLTADENYLPDYIVAVDTADSKMLGVRGTTAEKSSHIALCIDHHISNLFYAEKTCLDENAAAAAEVIYEIVKLMGVTVTKSVAESIYVGVSTDTGCFRYANTTAQTLRIAADMADLGIDLAAINKIQFETKSREYADLEKMAIASMESHLDGKCEIIVVTHDMFVKSGVADSETQPLASFPKQIDGVLVGITMKEKKEGVFRISIRTNAPADASAIAKHLDGGGHRLAAGCTFKGSRDDAVKAVLGYTETVLAEEGLI